MDSNMQYKVQTKVGELLLVKVPEDATWWKLQDNNLPPMLTEALDLNDQFLFYGKHRKILGKRVPSTIYYNPDSFCLLKGKWKIVGKFSQLKDRDLKKFVDVFWLIGAMTEQEGFKNYTDYSIGVKSAKESFQSLCKSQGIEDDLNNYLIVKHE